MFLKEKRHGTMKARGCADGRPQRLYTNKEDASSPTVSIEAMMLSCTIGTWWYQTSQEPSNMQTWKTTYIFC